MKNAPNKALDSTTEEKIKDVARSMFTRKGFAATRVKDIAEESGINMALLNYYFRSKENLFDLIMVENIQQVAGSVHLIMTDESTSLREKIEKIVTFYIDLFTAQPELPLFIFSELNANPKKLGEIIGKKQLLRSHFARQVQEEMAKNQLHMHPLQVLMSIMSLIVFPFVGRPVVQLIGRIESTEFYALMQERKQLIPRWIDGILKGG
ncbi:TetR/AcrR family transcriptional regulator [Spirosoma agri]|uniref:TetR/AcrR family transcriptional regulator n=1 Tax=Spirosoma agri TaxID=1987381 RepID=A0A6M0IRD4_9BACT|nr:TetR/AcrR family transcriptional regulator [Spirosoma agri]NEU70889.1 TetR/AcrR family transcriptional regulator [Spirosoma agri]